MKNIFRSTTKIVTLLLAICAIVCLPACNDNPDAFVSTKGKPTVDYIRLPDITKSDSIVTHAFMGSTIALMGTNLTSVKQVIFNNVPVKVEEFNTSLITATTLIVNVPNTIPTVVTNKLYLVSTSGDTVSLDFKVDVPAPMVNSMKCERVAVGGTAVIRGDFFLDDPNIPLQVIFPGNIPATNILSIAKTEIQVVVPAGATIPGQINVKSLYGNGRSSFWFLDNRGYILDWDNTNANGGWRSGVLDNANPIGISGNYVRFTGTIKPDPDWVEDGLSFNLWGTANGRPQGDLFSIDPKMASIKFEVNVDQYWSSGAVQMIFTPWATSGTNGYISDATVPRGLWMPWKDATDGKYKTDGWETVTIPLSQFKYNGAGKVLDGIAPIGNYGGLTFFLFTGGVTGKLCTPDICIDNIRVVPN